jgi:GTP pyrophosphokinase
MQRVADNGVAAHWSYKQGAESGETDKAFPWVEDLLEILEDSNTGDEFLENTKLELYQDQVFCFTPKGRLIPLPRGATPVDFAYAVHSHVGDTCVGAKVNGRIMPLRSELQNGDQVEIITSRNGTPSPAWERFAVTGKARARIRRFVALQQRQGYLDAGKSALAKAFRQEGLDGSERVLEGALKQFKCPTVDDLYVTVGNGNIGPKDVVHAAYPELRQAPRTPRMIPQMPARAPSRPAGGTAGISGLLPNMVVSYAGCCHPLPGDQIVGIVTTGKGVTVHAKGCQTLEGFATPERFIDISWDGETPTGMHTGRLSVIAAQEPGMLANVTNAVSKHDGSINNLKIVNKQKDFQEILLDVEVRDLRHLHQVMAGLRAAQGVTQVDRTRT